MKTFEIELYREVKMDEYFIVVKDGAVVTCTQNATEATGAFLAGADGMYKVKTLAEVQKYLQKPVPQQIDLTQCRVSEQIQQLKDAWKCLRTKIDGFIETDVPKARDKYLRTFYTELRQFIAKLDDKSNDKKDE